mmetsp:Transcript_3257/g.9579  ORF Transcript_3257/g.9579 Transcript_3257/m.9579 type:complete len:208 (+) Transcript_3257:180-803(+)
MREGPPARRRGPQRGRGGRPAAAALRVVHRARRPLYAVSEGGRRPERRGRLRPVGHLLRSDERPAGAHQGAPGRGRAARRARGRALPGAGHAGGELLRRLRRRAPEGGRESQQALRARRAPALLGDGRRLPGRRGLSAESGGKLRREGGGGPPLADLPGGAGGPPKDPAPPTRGGRAGAAALPHRPSHRREPGRVPVPGQRHRPRRL